MDIKATVNIILGFSVVLLIFLAQQKAQKKMYERNQLSLINHQEKYMYEIIIAFISQGEQKKILYSNTSYKDIKEMLEYYNNLELERWVIRLKDEEELVELNLKNINYIKMRRTINIKN